MPDRSTINYALDRAATLVCDARTALKALGDKRRQAALAAHLASIGADERLEAVNTALTRYNGGLAALYILRGDVEIALARLGQLGVRLDHPLDSYAPTRPFRPLTPDDFNSATWRPEPDPIIATKVTALEHAHAALKTRIATSGREDLRLALEAFEKTIADLLF